MATTASEPIPLALYVAAGVCDEQGCFCAVRAAQVQTKAALSRQSSGRLIYRKAGDKCLLFDAVDTNSDIRAVAHLEFQRYFGRLDDVEGMSRANPASLRETKVSSLLILSPTLHHINRIFVRQLHRK